MADTRTQLNTVRARIAQDQDLGWSVPVQLLEELRHLELLSRNEQAAEAAEELRLAYAEGHAHGLTGHECDWEEEDITSGVVARAEQAWAREFLRGYRDGQALSEVCPEAQVEALESEIRDWLTAPDTHPAKAPKIEELHELLEIATARLSTTTLAA